MLDATDVKAHPTASSLNKGMLNPIDRRSRRERPASDLWPVTGLYPAQPEPQQESD